MACSFVPIYNIPPYIYHSLPIRLLVDSWLVSDILAIVNSLLNFFFFLILTSNVTGTG